MDKKERKKKKPVPAIAEPIPDPLRPDRKPDEGPNRPDEKRGPAGRIRTA
jgi:hypothetical protein